MHIYHFRRTRPDGSTNERFIVSSCSCDEKRARELFTQQYGNAAGWKLLIQTQFSGQS